MAKKYDRKFFAKTYSANRRSAEVVLSILFRILDIRSVVDIGCGVGTWLEAAQNLGAETVLGFDGPWLKEEYKIIERGAIITQNLEEKIEVNSKFDLAISMEVAEHLSADRAEGLVEDLCSSSDLVLFSAAIPGQGGRNHINERWQSYWAGNFQKNGFIAYDFVRPKIWCREDIQSYYRQNIVIYCRAESAANTAMLSVASAVTDFRQLDIVDPEIFVFRTKPRGARKIWQKHLLPIRQKIVEGFRFSTNSRPT